MSARPFRWQDGERLIIFGRGTAGDALATIGEDPFVLLTTGRSRDAVPGLAAAAAGVHDVALGRVDELAEALLDEIDPAAARIVALGGGRVIDVAKAIAAARIHAGQPAPSVAAIPTTLSGAEMTPVHRHATRVPMTATRVRPQLVISDPALCASQPAADQAASAANALGHLAEGPLTPMRHPVATQAALEGARLLARAFSDDAAPGEDRDDALALAALLAGFVIGSTWYGLHHVIAQTLARLTPAGHGGANAIMLPYTLGALRLRFPDEIVTLGHALNADPVAFAADLAALTGRSTLSEAGVTEDQLDRCAAEAAGRPELHMTPPVADAAELRSLLAAAY